MPNAQTAPHRLVQPRTRRGRPDDNGQPVLHDLDIARPNSLSDGWGGGNSMNDMKPKRELTYATVCSGIECMSVACIGLPMRPVFFSEIEPFPCAVLKAHYPNVPNLGDMSQIRVLPSAASSADTTFRKEITNGTTRVILDEPLGILAGGTPCQDVSVAGKRAGMQEGSGTRSSLAFDFVRLARELRPRWVLWENVAGSIDSKNAPDFLRFASALGDCGYSLAWRVLDAQYVRVDGMEHAVPQRRRRVWVVGCLGADESVPAQILFEPDCVAGHTPPRRRAGQGFAYTLARRDRVDAGVVGDATRCDVLNFQGSKGNNCVTDDGSCPNLNAMHGHDVHVVALDGINPQGGGMNPFDRELGETQSVCHQGGVMQVRTESVAFLPANSANAQSIGAEDELSPTLTKGGGESGNKPSVAIGFKAGQSADGGLGDEREVSPTLSHKPSALEPTLAQDNGMKCLNPQDQQTGRVYDPNGAMTSLQAGGGVSGMRRESVLMSDSLSQMRYIVRRLTPTEAERLMGLPDGYTIPVGLRAGFADGAPSPSLVAEFQRIHDTFGAIMAEYEHKPAPKPKSANQVRAWLEKITNPATCPDSPRCRATGNGWATNQPRWILTRLLALGEHGDPFAREEDAPCS